MSLETNLINPGYKVDYSKMRMDRNANYQPQILALQKRVDALELILKKQTENKTISKKIMETKNKKK